MLRPRLGACPVHALVTVWGPAARRDEAFPAEPVAGVRVLPGRCLAAALESIADAAVAPAAVDEAWELLRDHVERRDASDLRTKWPPSAPGLFVCPRLLLASAASGNLFARNEMARSSSLSQLRSGPAM